MIRRKQQLPPPPLQHLHGRVRHPDALDRTTVPRHLCGLPFLQGRPLLSRRGARLACFRAAQGWPAARRALPRLRQLGDRALERGAPLPLVVALRQNGARTGAYFAAVWIEFLLKNNHFALMFALS